jgi:hypothetical protein
MHMIRHQTVGVERAMEASQCPPQVKEIKAAIRVRHEAWRAVVAALNDV